LASAKAARADGRALQDFLVRPPFSFSPVVEKKTYEEN
jgi:hypothetical protein